MSEEKRWPKPVGDPNKQNAILPSMLAKLDTTLAGIEKANAERDAVAADIAEAFCGVRVGDVVEEFDDDGQGCSNEWLRFKLVKLHLGKRPAKADCWWDCYFDAVLIKPNGKLDRGAYSPPHTISEYSFRMGLAIKARAPK